MVSRIAAAFVFVFYVSILFAAGLEFLGLGDVNKHELGRDALLGAGQLDRAPGRVVALRLPGVAIALTVVALVFIIDGIDEV